MAWNPNDPNDPNKPKTPQQMPAAQAPAVKPTPPPVVQGAPGTSEQLKGAQAVGQRKGTGFTGISRIMRANVGGRLGQQVVGQIGQAGQRVQQQTGEAAQKFETQLGQAQQQYGTAYGTATDAAQGVISGQPSQSVLRILVQPVQPPSGAIAPQFDPATLGAYQTAVGGQYTGPTGLEDYAELEAQAERARLMGEEAQSVGGRMDLLQRTYGRGERQYTASQAALDALLLGKSAKDLAAAKRQSADVFEDVLSQQEVAEAKARQAGADITAQSRALSQKVGATEAQELARVKAQKVDYEKKLSDLSKKVQEEMTAGELSNETLGALKSLGIDENTQFYGMQPEEIAKLIGARDPSEISEASVASEEQVRKLNALRRLSGQQDVFSQTDVEKAGSTRDPSAAFRFKGDIGDILRKQKDSFESLFGGIISEDEKVKLQRFKEEEARLQDEITSASYHSQDPKLTALEKNMLADRKAALRNQLFSIQKRWAGPFFAESYGGSAVNRDLMNRFLGGDLYDKTTGKLNVDFANQLKNMLADRKVYKGRKGFLGTGGRKFGQDPADAARIAALEEVLKRYGTGSTFKKKTE